MLRQIVSCLVLFFLTTFATTAFAQTAVLQGTVTDEETGEQLAGSNIVLLSPETGLQITGTSTNEQGEFERVGIAPGTYNIRVTFIGYEAKILPDVTFSAGETKTLTIVLTPGAIESEQVIVTASRRQEKVLEAPASVSVIETSQIEERTAMTPTDHLIGVASVDIVKSGLVQSNVVVRGFNNVFSGALLSLVDNRIARVPSLRVNVYNFIPTSNDDIERIEMVRGPGSALYGPNSANGVFHMITKSPFGSEGTTFNISGGERSVLMGSIRHAGSFNNRIGYKFSATYAKGNDFEHTDPIEEFNRNVAINNPLNPADPDTLKIGKRDFGIEKIAGTGRLDYRLNDDLTLIANGGFNRASHIELTGLGAAQAVDWTYSYVQGRMLYKKLFMQAYMNMSNAGDSYLLQTGDKMVDESKLMVYQLQHSTALGDNQNFTYGFDAIWTRPETKETINGRNEDNDNINEYGLYLQSETKLSDQLKFVFAGRYDDHNWLEEGIFSSRTALVFKPNPAHNFRITYNEAFNTPTSNNLFLDLVTTRSLGGLPYAVRVHCEPETGYTFRRDSPGLGGLYMQTPFAPVPSQYLPAEATSMWPAIVNILAQQGTDISLIPAPTAASVGTILRVLNTSTAAFDLTTPDYVKDIDRIRSNKIRTLEFGYKGILGKKFLAGIDVYYSTLNDFVGPLRVETPNVFFDPATLGAYLYPILAAPPYNLPQQQIETIIGNIAAIPVGTITPNEARDPGDLMLTYKNFGDIDLYGLDLSFAYYMNPNWRFTGSYSYVSKDFFKEDPSDIALNAPKNKFSGSVHYTCPRKIFDGQLRFRYVDGFPVNSGVYIGQSDNYTVFDFAGGIDLPAAFKTRLSLTIQNVLDYKHREFFGVPEIGRLALLRLTYSLDK